MTNQTAKIMSTMQDNIEIERQILESIDKFISLSPSISIFIFEFGNLFFK